MATTEASPTVPAAKPVSLLKPCVHRPKCPPRGASDEQSARLVVFHHIQGWGLLCNGVVVFQDGRSI